MRRIALGLATALLLSLAATAQAADTVAPDATLELKEGSVAAGIGFSWGGGTLTYQGKTYKVSVEGLSVGAVGIAEATATGKVFDLKDIKQFDGVYTATSLGAAAAVGGDVTVMRNENGVRIELVSTTKGVKVAVAAGGVKLKIKE